MSTIQEYVKERGISEDVLDAARERLTNYIASHEDPSHDSILEDQHHSNSCETPPQGDEVGEATYEQQDNKTMHDENDLLSMYHIGSCDDDESDPYEDDEYDSESSDNESMESSDDCYSLHLALGTTCDVDLPNPDVHLKPSQRFLHNHEILKKHGRTITGIKFPKMQGPGAEGLPPMTTELMKEALPACHNDDLLIDLYDSHLLDGVETVLELGAGDGRQLIQMVDSNPNITGYAVDDRKGAINDINWNARRAGVADRIHAIKQDFNDPIVLPDGVKADLVYSAFAMHGIDAVHAIDRLQAIRGVMSKGGLLAFKAAGSAGRHTVLIDLVNEILMTHGRRELLTLDYFSWRPCEMTTESVLRAAGFVDVITMSIDHDEGVVIHQDDPDVRVLLTDVLPHMRNDGLLTDEEVRLVRTEFPELVDGLWAGDGINIAFALNPDWSDDDGLALPLKTAPRLNPG